MNPGQLSGEYIDTGLVLWGLNQLRVITYSYNCCRAFSSRRSEKLEYKKFLSSVQKGGKGQGGTPGGFSVPGFGCGSRAAEGHN